MRTRGGSALDACRLCKLSASTPPATKVLEHCRSHASTLCAVWPRSSCESAMSTWVAVTRPGKLGELLLLLAVFMCPRTTPVSLPIGLQQMKAHESGPGDPLDVQLAKTPVPCLACQAYLSRGFRQCSNGSRQPLRVRSGRWRPAAHIQKRVHVRPSGQLEPLHLPIGSKIMR